MSMSDQFLSHNISAHFQFQLTKFEGDKLEHIGQLFITPEMVAKKIKKMKYNKSPGVDGIPPQLFK